MSFFLLQIAISTHTLYLRLASHNNDCGLIEGGVCAMLTQLTQAIAAQSLKREEMKVGRHG